MTTVTVIIPVKDDTESLVTCLAAIAAGSITPDEVCVVDNGSNPPLAIGDLGATGLPVRLLHEPTPGSYAARNLAIEKSTGQVLAFTDADCVPSEDWLEAGVTACLISGRPVGGRIITPLPEGRPSAVAWFDHLEAFPIEKYVAEGYAVTANLFVPRDVMAAVGPFDATLQSSGDFEWGLRARDAGRPVEYGPSVVISHPPRQTRKAFASKALRVRAGRQVLHQRDPERFSIANRRRWRLPVLVVWRTLTDRRMPMEARVRVAALRCWMRWHRFR